ncbi:type VI secretion system protein [Pseudomonas agarici]|nr:type VI secretion system protein [Pseudomonas agarici]
MAAVNIELLPQTRPGHLEYALDAQFKGGERMTFGATLAPEGKVLVRHLKRQNYLP